MERICLVAPGAMPLPLLSSLSCKSSLFSNAPIRPQGPCIVAQGLGFTAGASKQAWISWRPAAVSGGQPRTVKDSDSEEQLDAVMGSEDEDGGEIGEFNEADFEALAVEEELSGYSSEDFEPQCQDDAKPQKKSRRRRRGDTKGPELPSHLLPKVAIVGRPNVGKSAIFNRIAGRNMAIVHDEPGVTRDRLYARGHFSGQDFMLVDTGGVLTIPSSGTAGTDGLAITHGGGALAVAQATKEAIAAGLPAMIEKQAASAVEEASALIFVVDGQTGATAADIDIADWLRRKYSHKKVNLAVNKCESPKKGLLQASEFWSLGFTPIPVSAISGAGIPELLDAVCCDLKLKQDALEVNEAADRPLAIAIIGRPNVGKSSILNALVGEERTIVSAVSGTTRDAIDTEVSAPDGKVFRLIDTAGIRRRAAIASGGSKTEALCVSSALKAIRRSDVVALVLEAMTCATEQDFRLGERIEKDGKACIIVVNKWDTVPNKDGESTYWYEKDVREKLRVLKWAPIVYTSATKGQRIPKILEVALRAGQERERRISTAIINQVMQDALSLKQPPTTRGGKKGRIYFCTQAAIRPPTFVFFVNDEKLFPEDYIRYMEKQLRQNIGFPGTPIRLFWRSKKLVRGSSKSSSQSNQPAKNDTYVNTETFN